MDVGHPQSNNDLRALARGGEAAEAILLALARDEHVPFDAPEFEAHLQEYRQEGSRDLSRLGYRLRLAEIQVVGCRHMVPVGQVEEMLRSEKSSQERIESIADYLDTHETVGLGEPVRLYVRGPFEELCKALDQLVELAVRSNPAPSDEFDLQPEVYARLIAYGYVYKVAEDLVRQGMPSSWGEPGIASAEPERGKPEEDAAGELWSSFRDKPNSEAVLCEKANVVASLIEMDWDTGLIVAAMVKDTLDAPQFRVGEEEARRVLAETAVLLIRIVDEIAFGVLGPEGRDAFMDELHISVGRALESKGVELTAFANFLSQRLSEYARYRKWVAGENEGAKDTLLWEFGKKIGAIVGVEKHALFMVLLSNLLLRGVDSWQLPELLRG